MFVALETPSPRTRASPVPRNVSARPETTWSARNEMVITAWTRLSRPPASIATSDAEPRVAGRDAGREPGDRAEEHHPLDPEVQDAGALGEDLADRREEQDRAGRDARGEDVGDVHQAIASRRSNRIR